ncbi:hypothetical protein M9H77_10256 [Catharanthus roseus]|uniref:Uncharacterized protein n=1 Tax=Catharanthus roseus TaxID=4058 RepID=A0ACC0C2Z3_CATRO|nr:hypothetical protein M9H77_10256 [Catharanthus roseus]
MSENSQKEELREEGSIAAEDGGVEPSAAAAAAGNLDGEEVQESEEPVNQVDALHSVQDDSDNVKVAEDVGREDTFVDCSEEIENSEAHQSEESKDIVQDTQSEELNNENNVQELTAEVQNLRNKLERIVAEKCNVEQDYEEERVALKREVNYLHCQLKALNAQQSSTDKNDDGLIDNYYSLEASDNNEKNLTSLASLHEMINDCSKLLESTLDRHLQTKCSIKDLQTALQMKDLEIESLNSKIIECSVSQDVIFSYLSSTNEIFSQPSEVQLERDRNIEEIANRILVSLPKTFHEEGLAEESIVEKYSHVEESIQMLSAKHSAFLSELRQLRCCLTEIPTDISPDDEVEIFSAVRDKLLELKRREVDMDQKLSHFENENVKLAEQLNRNQTIIESANAEIAKLNAELEQEKMRYANTKEKLSLAVTKGKALVQQRDSLKQALADRTSELEKYLAELQEKSSALEAADQSKDLLLRSENFAASLQESLFQRDSILQKCEELLSEAAGSESVQSLDIVEKIRWLSNQRNELQGVALEFNKLSDVLSSISFPEDVPLNDLDTQIKWLVQSFYLAKEEALKLQDDIARIREAAHKEIDHLTTSLLAETQEKDYLQEELQDLRRNYETLVEKEYQVSSEKDELVSMLLKASGITINNQEEVNFSQHGVSVMVDKCLTNIKEQVGEPLETSQDKVEVFEKLQSLLYVRDQDSMLYMKLLEEEMLDRAEMNRLSRELVLVNEALCTLKAEKDTQQKDLERSEEKAALLREKLSMAVKKGKGLVQDRENLKGMLDGKNTEIESLKSELHEQVVTCNDLKDQINKLMAQVDRIPELETELAANEERRNDLEKFLLESNNMLHRLIECIDSIDLPADVVFQEPSEKVKWLATCLDKCQTAEAQAQQELETVKLDANTLISKMKETETAMNLMEKSLADAESQVSHLLEEKRELEIAKIQSEEELQKALEEATSLKSKFTEVSATARSQEDALMSAEENISKLIKEREDAIVSKAAADEELGRLTEENSINVSKLVEAEKLTKSLEDAFSHIQTSFTLLSDEHNKALIGRSNTEDELNKLKVEADFLSSKLSDASMTIKSLEDALATAENNISDLVQENKNAEEEISALNSKLNACLQELAGTHGSIENNSLELFDKLSSLQLLLRDDTLLSLIQQTFVKKTESLKDMDLLFRDIKKNFLEMDSEVLQNYPVTEDDSSLSTLLHVDSNDDSNLEISNGDVNAAEDENITLHIQRTVEKFHSRDKTLANRIESFARFLDNLILVVLERLRATKDGVVVTLELVKSLQQKVHELEMERHVQENTISILENDVKTLLSSCTNAIHELESESENDLLDLSSIPILGNSSEHYSRELGALDENGSVDHELEFEGSNHKPSAEKLLRAARHSRLLTKQFHGIKRLVVNTIEGLQNELEEIKLTCRKFSEERDLNHHQISKLETDLGALQNLYNETRLEVEDYQAREATWKEREVELSTVHATSVMKVHEFEDFPLSTSQIRTLFDKINAIDISFTESEVHDLETHDSADVWKLFYIVDKFTGLLQKIKSEAQERQSLQSKLENQVLENEYLKEEVAGHVRDKQESERQRNELALGLEDIIQKLGGDDLVGVHKVDHVTALLPILEKIVTHTRAESEIFKSKAEELSTKLLKTQKLVDDLSAKLKLLEESKPVVVNRPETVQEKGIFESSSLPANSEISEIQDPGPIAKNTAVSSIASAAHARTLRKGSSDHLAIVVDPESQRLVNNEQADDEKGHVFKSLNTSGLIPRQGKMVADRLDGIWVSGGRALMSHPRARLGFIAYWLFLHIWVLGSIL